MCKDQYIYIYLYIYIFNSSTLLSLLFCVKSLFEYFGLGAAKTDVVNPPIIPIHDIAAVDAPN